MAQTGYILETSPIKKENDGISFIVKKVERPANFSFTHLVYESWKAGEFKSALLGKLPDSWDSFIYYPFDRFNFVLFMLLVYAIWFWRPGWISYVLITSFFLTCVYIAKTRLVWQFLRPLNENPQLYGQISDFIYLWAKYSPF